MMNLRKHFRWYLWLFGHFQVRMIGYLRPKIIEINDQKLVVKIALNRRSRNHLRSMYFGALAVGADVAGGFHGFYHAEKEKLNVSLVFKSFRAQFLRRPEHDVYFVSNMGDTVAEMLERSKGSGERQNEMIRIDAFTGYPNQSEKVAEFDLELSIKVLNQ